MWWSTRSGFLLAGPCHLSAAPAGPLQPFAELLSSHLSSRFKHSSHHLRLLGIGIYVSCRLALNLESILLLECSKLSMERCGAGTQTAKLFRRRHVTVTTRAPCPGGTFYSLNLRNLFAVFTVSAVYVNRGWLWLHNSRMMGSTSPLAAL